LRRIEPQASDRNPSGHRPHRPYPPSREGRVIATEDVKTAIRDIGINKCARESGFDRKNFIRKLVRDIPVKRNSYDAFLSWLESH
jgi:hypothetical protein